MKVKAEEAVSSWEYLGRLTVNSDPSDFCRSSRTVSPTDRASVTVALASVVPLFLDCQTSNIRLACPSFPSQAWASSSRMIRPLLTLLPMPDRLPTPATTKRAVSRGALTPVTAASPASL